MIFIGYTMSVVYLDLFQSYIALISEKIKCFPICLFTVYFIMQIINGKIDNGVCLFSWVILLIFRSFLMGISLLYCYIFSWFSILFFHCMEFLNFM